MFDVAVREIITAGQRLAGRGLICAHSGNISRRLDEANVLITASGMFKGGLREEDVLRLDYQGRVRQGEGGRQPSSETDLHLALYKSYPHIEAIIHAHPPYATALACAGQELDYQLLEESRLFLGPTPLLPRLNPGSTELAQRAAQAAGGVNALLLSGHGAVSWGKNLEQAFNRMEILEHTAHIMLLHGLFGGVVIKHV